MINSEVFLITIKTLNGNDQLSLIKLVDDIEVKTQLCVNAVKTGDRKQAIIFRDQVIELMIIKEKKFSLNDEEKDTLRTLKHLAKHQNNKRLKDKIISKINK